jgi:hypothetical protein
MEPYKRCTSCHKSWADRDELLDDLDINITGFQPTTEGGVHGFVLINHDAPGCGSTLAIEAESLLDLYTGPVHDSALFGADDCKGHCYRVDDLSECDSPCRNAMVREVIKQLLERRRRLIRSVG